MARLDEQACSRTEVRCNSEDSLRSWGTVLGVLKYQWHDPKGVGRDDPEGDKGGLGIHKHNLISLSRHSITTTAIFPVDCRIAFRYSSFEQFRGGGYKAKDDCQMEAAAPGSSPSTPSFTTNLAIPRSASQLA